VIWRRQVTVTKRCPTLYGHYAICIRRMYIHFRSLFYLDTSCYKLQIVTIEPAPLPGRPLQNVYCDVTRRLQLTSPPAANTVGHMSSGINAAVERDAAVVPSDSLPPWEWQPAADSTETPQPAASSPIAAIPAAELPSTQRPRCDHVDSSGSRCDRTPIKGGTVCTSHGGQLPTVRAAAQLRLLLLAEPAMETLHKALGLNCRMTAIGGVAYCEVHGNECPDWATRASAAKAILDRTGFGPKSTVVMEKPPNEFAAMSTEDLAAELQGLAAEVRSRMQPRFNQPTNQPALPDIDIAASA